MELPAIKSQKHGKHKNTKIQKVMSDFQDKLKIKMDEYVNFVFMF